MLEQLPQFGADNDRRQPGGDIPRIHCPAHRGNAPVTNAVPGEQRFGECGDDVCLVAGVHAIVQQSMER